MPRRKTVKPGTIAKKVAAIKAGTSEPNSKAGKLIIGETSNAKSEALRKELDNTIPLPRPEWVQDIQDGPAGGVKHTENVKLRNWIVNEVNDQVNAKLHAAGESMALNVKEETDRAVLEIDKSNKKATRWLIALLVIILLSLGYNIFIEYKGKKTF